MPLSTLVSCEDDCIFHRSKRNVETPVDAAMQTAFRRRNGDCLVLMSGRITIDSSPQLRTLLMQAVETPEYESLTVDFYEVAYVDVSGLAILLEVLRTARQLKKSFRLSGLRGRSRYVLEATRLLHLFEEVDRNVPQ